MLKIDNILPTKIVFISPHLDDVAFSCGGTVARFLDEGLYVEVITIFTKSKFPLTKFGKNCQTDKGVTLDIDYLALRKEEDVKFSKIIGGCNVIWLDQLEAPYRGYNSSKELFNRIKSNDIGFSEHIADLLLSLIDNARYVFFPIGIGNHVDHKLVRDAGMHLLPKREEKFLFYEEMPYCLKPEKFFSASFPPHNSIVSIDGFVEQKIHGASAYQTQIPFQFGTLDILSNKLKNYSANLVSTINITKYCERYWHYSFGCGIK